MHKPSLSDNTYALTDLFLIVYTCSYALTYVLDTPLKLKDPHWDSTPSYTLKLKPNTHPYTCSGLGPPNKK